MKLVGVSENCGKLIEINQIKSKQIRGIHKIAVPCQCVSASESVIHLSLANGAHCTHTEPNAWIVSCNFSAMYEKRGNNTKLRSDRDWAPETWLNKRRACVYDWEFSYQNFSNPRVASESPKFSLSEQIVCILFNWKFDSHCRNFKSHR